MLKKLVRQSLITALLTLFFVAPASADANDVREAKRSLRAIKAQIKLLKKLRARDGVRAQLAKGTAGMSDGDSDGLSDLVENIEGTGSCETDSDDDGISDGEEEHSGSDPDDSSSGEVEVKGLISAIDGSSVTVDGYTFIVNESSRFESGSDITSFNVGDLVEVSGRTVDGTLVLKKIKIED